MIANRTILKLAFFPTALILCVAEPARAQCEPCFSNATVSSGFRTPDELGGHGIQVVDVNGDGWLDVYVTHIADPTQDRPDLLFINQRTNPPQFAEEGVSAGISDDGFYQGISEESHAAIFADFDDDGDYDLFNAHTWNGHNRFYRNDGSGRFVDLTESAGLEVTDLGSRGVAAADMNNDGRLDVVVSAWQGAQPIIYWNLGGLRFERQRIQGVDNRAFANQGITVTDYDGDRTPDLALTAYEYLDNNGLGPISLLKNNTDRFSDNTDFAGVSYERQSSNLRGTNGWTFADIDNDGDLDAIIAGSHGTKLYRGVNGEGRFTFVRRFDGAHYTAAFGDVDNDGDLDLYLAGDIGIYLNDGSGEYGFKEGLGLDGIGGDARSAVFADINNDGALDLLIASKQGINTFFVNNSGGGAWLKVSLVGPRGAAGAFGSKVYLYEAGHLEQADHLKGMRESRGGTGYCSQDPPIHHFGVDPESTYDILVIFQDGSRAVRAGVQPGQTVQIDGRSP